MTDIPIHWRAEVSPGMKSYFTATFRGLVAEIDPGDSLKEVRVVADDAFLSEIQSLNPRFLPGLHATKCVAATIEQENTFTSVIVIRQAFFTSAEDAYLEQMTSLIETVTYCRLFHKAWPWRGKYHSQSSNSYLRDLFKMCEHMHDTYAVARMTNLLLGSRFGHQSQGVVYSHQTEYGGHLAASFEQAARQLRALPKEKGPVLLDIAYRFIFEPLASHAGFLAPLPHHLPPRSPLQRPENDPASNAFYREVIAPYWEPIRGSLELSFDSQFARTEEELLAICTPMDDCLDRLLEER